MTRRQELQPSSRNSKMAPNPLNNQPKMPPPVKMMMIKTMTPMIVIISISTLFDFQVLEALAQGIEQRFSLVGFGSDEKAVRGLSFHADDIATIVDGIRTYE